MLSTIFFDVVPQNAESNVVPEYDVGHGGFLQMFKGRRLNIYHCQGPSQDFSKGGSQRLLTRLSCRPDRDTIRELPTN